MENRPNLKHLKASEELATAPPHDSNTEQEVISACLQGEPMAALAVSELQPEDFYRTYHQQIFAAIREGFVTRQFTDPATVREELDKRGLLEEAGGIEYLHALAREVPENLATEETWVSPRIKRVKELSVKRGVLCAARDITNLVDDGTLSTQDILEQSRVLFEAQRARLTPPEYSKSQDIVDFDAVDEQWLWEGWIELGAITALLGPPGAGKSWVLLSLMESVATGAPWPDGTPGPQSPSPVLLLDYECTQATTLRRVEAMGLLKRGLLHMQPPGCRPYLDKPDSIDMIRGWIQELQTPLVMIDSLREALPGVDEQVSGEMSAALKPLRILAEEMNCAVVIAAHSRKGQVNGRSRWELGPDDVRGSSAIAAAARTIMAIDKPDASRETRRLKIVKSNNAEKPEPPGFDIHSDGASWTDAPHGGRGMPVRSAAQEAVTIALQRAPKRFSELQRELEEDRYSRATISRALKQMENDRIIIKGQDGKWGLLSRS